MSTNFPVAVSDKGEWPRKKAMNKVIDLQRFRESTQAKRDSEQLLFPGMIAGLHPISLFWHEKRLVVEYETEDTELHSNVAKNPAWALDLFGIIDKIRAMSLTATIVCPDRIAAYLQSDGDKRSLVIRVVYRTREIQQYETRMFKQTLAQKGCLKHIFPA